MKKPKKENRKIATIDFETDPFKFGRVPKPFAAGFYDGEKYVEFWGNDCARNLINFLRDINDEYIIYAHNGGKFDFFYLLQENAIENPLMMISGRIVKCRMGRHELRDSYSILPMALKSMDKEEIDYKFFEVEEREKYKKEICDYLKSDCENLFNWVSNFRERYGDKLTVGGAAFSELKKNHEVVKCNAQHDALFRKYYYGGRVECFESGSIRGNFKVYDVNSMYPKAMRDYDHPMGWRYIKCDEKAVDINTGACELSPVYFIRFNGENNGALPTRLEKGGIDFNIREGEFFACSHEIKIALKYNLIKINKIISVFIPAKTQRFAGHVDKFIEQKIECKKQGDKVGETFAKLMLNSPYGKFATNPEKFTAWYICDITNDESLNGLADFQEKFAGAVIASEIGHYEMWMANDPDPNGYIDVACAASITSASRAILLEAIQHCTRPLYCDTDSLICEGLSGVTINDYELGAWKFEGSTTEVHIAGKKLYSMILSGSGKTKIASKGAKLSHDDIVRLCNGEDVTWRSDAPNFKAKMLGEDTRDSKNEIVTKFIERKIVRNNHTPKKS